MDYNHRSYCDCCFYTFSYIRSLLADSGGYRKFFLMIFTWICSVFSILLYFPESGDVYLALSIFVIANISFEMGCVFSNSYLPDLSQKENIARSLVLLGV